MSGPLVLSLFPGIGLLDRAFEEEGFCIVRGPDLLWGQDARDFHPPAGRFDGVIGGPPCQIWSALKRLNPLAGEKHGDQIPTFARIVAEAEPTWFLMENVPQAPEPTVAGYELHGVKLNNRWFGEEQERTRRFCLGTQDGRRLLVGDQVIFENPRYRQAVTSQSRAVPVKLGGSGKIKRSYTAEGKRLGPNNGPRAAIADMARLQGLPPTFLDECPFTETAKRHMLGNGVPLPMGRAVARAVKRAMGYALEEAAS